MFRNKMESADSAKPLSQHYQLQQQADEDQDLAGEVTVVSSLIRSSLLAVHISTEVEDEEPRLSPPADVPLQTNDLPPADPASNSNFNNSCCTPPLQTDKGDRHPHPPPPEPTGSNTSEPPRKKSKGESNHGNIEVTLEGKNLWDEFHCRGTEMIVNRAGRRMFPGFSVAISGLKPKAKYTMKLDVVLAENNRFKFLNARWLPVGTAEPQPLSKAYIHPDAPNSGAYWMRHGVSFRKLKITNNKERPGSNILLHSMHKYFLRLVVEEERRSAPGEGRGPPRTTISTDFRETTFVAVTAYQNEEVTQLKICNNPFAKAFRENATDMDWETAQMLYNKQAVFSPQPQMEHLGSHLVAPGSWQLQSPLLPSTPITASFSPVSPMAGLTPSHPHGYFSPSPFSSSPLISNQHFQWPPNRSTQQELCDHAVYPPQSLLSTHLPQPHLSTHPPQPHLSIHPPQPHLSTHPPQPHLSTHPRLSTHPHLCTHPHLLTHPHQPHQSTHPPTNLPGFDSIFTSPLQPNST